MKNISMVDSVLYCSDILSKEGPTEIFNKIEKAGGIFKTFDELYNPYERFSNNSDKKPFDFIIKGLKYSASLIKETGDLFLGGSIDYIEQQKNIEIVNSCLLLLEEIIPIYVFKYGHFDFLGNSALTSNIIDKTKLTIIFWANFFGRPYVEKYGKDFLLNAPGWKKEELSDGTIEYVLTENIFDQIDPYFEKEIIEYFSKKTKVKRFVATPID